MELGSGVVPCTENANWLGYPVITPVRGSSLNVLEMMVVEPEFDQNVSFGEVISSPYRVM